MPITHSFQSVIADDPTAAAAGEVLPSHWNDAHVIALSASDIATPLHAATAKTVLVDADEVSGTDSANSFSLIRTVWSDVWTYIKSKADAVYALNAFKTISVSGQSDVVADSATDTLTLAAGTGVTITTDPSTDTVTIAASGGSGAGLTANTFTGAQEVDLAVGATSTDGVVLATTIAATVGAQKFSPRVRWLGSGWKTASTAGAQNVEFIAEVQPVQGSANPTGKLVFSSIINGGAPNVNFTIGDSGGVGLPNGYITTNGGLQLFNGSGSFISYTSAQFRLLSTGVFAWVNSSTDAFNAPDSGMSRIGPAVVGLGNGTAGNTSGDLQLRGLSFKTTFTVGTLPAAATAGDGMSYRVTDLTTPAIGSAPSGSGAVHGIVTSNGTSYTVTQFG